MKLFKELLLLPLIFLVVWMGMKWYKMPLLAQGALAPDFTAYTANSDSLKLSDYRGNLVLLEFWGFLVWALSYSQQRFSTFVQQIQKRSIPKRSGIHDLKCGDRNQQATLATGHKKRRLGMERTSL